MRFPAHWLSTAIKYLTQSTWSHAALYVGPRAALGGEASAPRCFVVMMLEGLKRVAQTFTKDVSLEP